MNKEKFPPPYTRTERQSNIEILRCVSMFMVMMMHSSFITFGFPVKETVQESPCDWVLHTFQYSIAIVAVNVFVLISGWFSIKPSIKGISSFLFQVTFLKLLSFIFFLVLGTLSFTKSTLYDLLMLNPYTGWFIKTYLLLYILVPVLNTFVENTTRKVFQNVLIFYFLFVFVMGWFRDITGYIMGGYSITMFVGLYLLARYANIYKPTWSCYSMKKDFIIYMIATFFTFLGIFLPVYFGMEKCDIFVQAFTRYSSPFVVLGAMHLLLLFSKLKIGTRPMINKVARSCFAVYLLHFMWGLFPLVILDIYETATLGVYYLMLFIWLVTIFFCCIVVDQLRVYIWNKITVKIS